MLLKLADPVAAATLTILRDAILDRALTSLLADLAKQKLAATDHPRAGRVPAATRRAPSPTAQPT